VFISSLFGKTRPVNYILSLSFLFVFFLLAHTGFSKSWLPAAVLPEKILSLGALLFSVLVVNFIVQRNQLTTTNAFALLFYCLFAVLFPETLVDPNVLFASFFLLLAERRLISLKSMKDVKSKVFDGALWILVSSLFINWMVVFLVLVWIYIYFYEPKNLKLWFIPLAAVGTIGLVGWAGSYLLGNPTYLLSHYSLSVALPRAVDFSGPWIRIVVFLFLALLAGLVSFLRQSRSGHGRLTQMRLLALGWLMGIVVLVLTRDRMGSTVMLTFFPSAVFLGKYVESIGRDFFRELVLGGSVLVSLGVFFSQWVLK
jgi:hypothetical protein